MNFLQELELVETVLSDIGAFAAGQPVHGAATIGGRKVSVEVMLLPNGPTPPYNAISGSVFAILGIVLADAAGIAAGAPVSLAVKEGNTWYGVTLSLTAG